MMCRILNITGTVVLTVFMLLLLPLTVPKLFGFELYHVMTGSMEPSIPAHSVIFVKSVSCEALQPGEVITFRLGSGSVLTETHRIVSIDTSSQTIVTKGDANGENDRSPVLFSSVVGRVVFSLPVLGAVSDVLHSAQGIGICVIIFAAVLLMWLAADRLRRKEKAA